MSLVGDLYAHYLDPLAQVGAEFGFKSVAAAVNIAFNRVTNASSGKYTRITCFEKTTYGYSSSGDGTEAEDTTIP